MAWIFFIVSVLALVWLAMLVGRRRREHRESEQAREMAFLLAHGNLPGSATRTLDAPVPSTDDDVGAGEGEPQAAQAKPLETMGFADHRRAYLDETRAAAYRRLKAALPSYEIFPRASLRRAAGLDAIEKDVLLDFVVCTRDLRPLAAIDLARGDRPSSANAVKRETLARAGVGYARWPHDALPDSASIAAWLIESTGGASGADVRAQAR